MRSIILPLILLSAVLAFAGYDVVNIQPGESHPIFPGVVKAVQLNASNVLPTNGTVSIGEITAKWETPSTNIEVSCEYADLTLTKTRFGWSGSGDYAAVDMTYGSPYDMGLPNQYHIEGFSGITFDLGDFIGRTNDVIDSISIGDQFELFGLTIAGYGEFQYTGHSVTCRVVSASIPHATTNAIWSVTAAGGNAVTNLPDKTFLETPANDWVRYGTATSGTVKLYVED